MRATTYIRILKVLYYKHLLESLSIEKTRKYTPFIILCHPRSGSTLLHTYLNSHPNILSLGEYLGNKVRNSNETKAAELVDKKLFKLYSRNIQAVGVKFFFQYTAYPLGKDMISLLASRQSVLVVYLYRENLLRNLVSLKIAENTGQYTMWKKGQKMKVEKRKIYLSAEECKTQLMSMDEHSHYCRKLFKNHDLLPISYESLVSHPTTTLTRVQKFLKVKPYKLQSLLIRQNPEPLTKLILNYNEIKQALASTKWAKMLEG
ncbi:MAG: sulfotransferase [Cyclobacteriaceae bacterium]